MLIVAVGCGPGPSSPGTDRVPEAALPRPVVLGGIEMCGEAEPVLVLLQGTEHPTWEPVSAERGGHVIRWHAFTPHQLADQGRPNGYAIREAVCGRTDPDVLTLEVVDGRVAEVNAAWSVPAADPSEALSCKQALEQGLGSTRGTPATHRDEWDAREMVMWVWSEPGLKTEVLIDTYNGADDWELLHDIPRRGTGVDPIFRPDDMEVGDVRVLMRFRCTPIVQQLARDMLREETVRD